jgi:Peptidase inhibitor family I36
MRQRLAFLFLTAAIACGRPAIQVGLRAPDPTGCYVIVYERANFSGAGDVLNGPARWPTLERIASTNEKNWRNRIRSLRVGSVATVSVYVDQDFKGASRRFLPKTEHPQLEQAFRGRIESLELACQGR